MKLNVRKETDEWIWNNGETFIQKIQVISRSKKQKTTYKKRQKRYKKTCNNNK